ncbi:MAG: hypothetical protein ABIH40_02885 [Candidatus Omnitrophota bacterium]
MLGRKTSFIIVLLLFLLLNLILFRNVIFDTGRLLSSSSAGDVFFYFSAAKFLEIESLRRGIMLWNPYVFGGVPWIANPQYQLFYPLNLPLLFLPFHLSINYSFILHILLLGIATCLFVRYLGFDWYVAMISGLISMLNGQVFLRCFAGHLTTLCAYLWLPVIFLLIQMCLNKRKLMYAVFAGLALGCQILAGNPQYVYYTLLGIFFYLAFMTICGLIKNRRDSSLKFTSVALFMFLSVGLGLACLRLLPILEFTRLSIRAVPSYDFAASWSFPARNLITYILPEFFGDMIHVPYWGGYNLWEMCGYVGVLPLILSLIAVVYKRNKYTLFFACLSLLALAGSLGANTPLFRLFYHLLPGFNKFRGHSKFLMLFVFSVGILSAYGLGWLLEKKEKPDRKLIRVTLLLGIFAGLVTAAVFFLFFNRSWISGLWLEARKAGVPSLDLAESEFSLAFFSLVKFNIFVVSIFSLFFFWIKKRISANILKIFLVVVLAADLLLFGAKYIVSDKVRRCYWDRDIVGFLKDAEAPQTYRVFAGSLRDDLFPNKAVLDRIPVIDGYDPLVLKRYDSFLRLCLLRSPDLSSVSKLLGIANLKYLILPKDAELNSPGLRMVFEGKYVGVWENAWCLPRVYIVHRAKVIKGSDETVLNAVLSDDFRPSETVILERDARLSAELEGSAQARNEKAGFIKYAYNEVVIRAELKGGGYLVLSDVNYPGWKASVLNLSTGEERQADIFYANYIFRCIPLEKGNYLIRFSFRPVSFFVGSFISVLTILSVILGLIFICRAGRRSL